MAKYHLGKVKIEQAGQRSSPTSVCDLRGGPRGIAGLLLCLLLVLLCLLIVADQFFPSCESLRILADRSGSMFAYLRIMADCCSLSSLPSISTEFIQSDGAG